MILVARATAPHRYASPMLSRIALIAVLVVIAVALVFAAHLGQ